MIAPALLITINLATERLFPGMTTAFPAACCDAGSKDWFVVGVRNSVIPTSKSMRIAGMCESRPSKILLDARLPRVDDNRHIVFAAFSPRILMSDIAFESERRAMVEEQLRRRGICDERVLQAMFDVPRHEFVPPLYIQAAYEDRPIVIGEGQTISQPYIVAAMTEAANIESGDKILEIGTGSGYQAAVLARLGARVITMERIPRLAVAARERLSRLGYLTVEVVAQDGSAGYPQQAPYDAIMVTAAAPAVPRTLVGQLADGGHLVIPVGSLHLQTLEVVSKHGEELSVRDLDPCQFVPLVGRQAWPEERN